MASDTREPRLRIRLLGGFSVSGPAGEVAGEWKLRKAKALVELLALAPEHRLNAEQTAELLWDDRSPAAARNNLHQALHAARRALEPCGVDGRRALTLSNGVLALCPDDPPWIDVVAFTETAAAARSACDVEAYRAALALYTGELLPEHRYEEWTVQRRDGLRDLRLALGVELAELEAAAGAHAVAIETLRALLDDVPLYEPAHRALMRLLARTGRRQEALAQFHDLKRRLRREFEDAPDETTRQLYQQLLAREVTSEPDPGDVQPPSEPQARHERKHATVLFAELSAADEDPEAADVRAEAVRGRLSAEVERYGGQADWFLGERLRGVFGVPTSHEDDPERAVRAALQIHAVVSEVNRGSKGADLGLRIGVDAGHVLVEPDGTVSGGAVKAATRLQARAAPGQVLVAQPVHEATAGVIEYRELAESGAWEALQVRARLGGRRTPLGFESRLIGREDELGLLEATLGRVEADGRPALITVLGTAGVGKTRLVHELAERVDASPRYVYWRAGRCPAYAGVSYSALAEAVKAECEVRDDDPPGAVAEKVDRALSELFGSRELAPHVLSLIGAAEHESSREELFDAWRRFLERMAARYPLVLVLEDLHWADGGLLDFVEHLADWGQGPICVLTTARPELLEARPSWGGGRRRFLSVDLDPLSLHESEAMVDDLLGGSLPARERELVARRGEGNPLFTEEIVRSLIDGGALRKEGDGAWTLTRSLSELDLPRSVTAVIAARLDLLPAAEKAILQDAAVIGRRFWAGAVARLAGLSAAEVRELLGRLRVKELVHAREPSVFSGEAELGFRHALIRDVAYEALPKAARAEKHLAAARWAQERAGARGTEFAELIASHYSQALEHVEQLGRAGDDRAELERRTLRWARAAGERAMGLSQPAQAARWLRRAVQLADVVGLDTLERAKLLEAYGDAALRDRAL